MRNTITKTVSMMLVTVMVLGIGAMPFRIFAGQAEIADMASPALEQIAKLNNALTSDDEEAKQSLKALFPIYDPDIPVASVSISDLEGLAKTLSRNGISAVFEAKYNAEYSQEIWYLTCESIDSFPVNIYGQYAPGGRYVVAVPDGSSSAEQSTDKYSGQSKTEIKQVFDNSTNTWIDVEVTDIDQSTTNNSVSVDFKTGTFYDINGGTLNVFDKLVYNPVTQTYDVTFTDNRHYTYQFYYDYTYITYIGSSAEYREAYKVYYELPDGRSSGDLTADELKGLSLQFDMVNYDKAPSDTLTRALYDFDGDLQNSSAFDSTAQWLSGASTTYLEAPDGFGGCLFNNNPFELRFSLDGVSNEAYTVQFRLYFENLPTSDFYVYAYGNPWFINVSNDSNKRVGLFSFTLGLGDQYLPMIRINQGNVYFAYGDSVITTIQAGQWYDFTLCFDWSTYSANATMPSSYNALYLYVNGLLVGSGEIMRILYKYYSEGWVNNGFRDYTNDFTYFSFNVRDLISGSYENVRTNLNSSALGYTNFWTVRSAWPAGYKLQRSAGVTTNTYPAKAGNYFAPYTFNALGFRCDGSYTMMLDNLRVVNHSLYSGVQSFTPTPVPFSPNLVYVLPSVADLNDNTVAIMSQLPVSGYRVGGIRPTDPTLASGYVYMHIDGEYIDSVQQWNGAYWEEVTARLYTGIRWIPVTAFNVFTLEDMFDIIDPDADGSGDNVDDIYKYYLWWSGEWGSFQQWLQGTMQTLIEAIQASGGGSGGSDAPVVIVPGYNDQTTTSEITTENPDGSTTKTTIVSNAAGLVYSNSVTTYPTDADGNTKTITVYTDSSGVMYQTETIIDKDGNVTVTEPTKATGTLGSILKMITNGVMSIAGTVIEGFVTIVVDGVKFIIESAGDLFDGIADLFTGMFGAVTDFTDSVQDYVNPPGINPAVDGDDDEQGDGDGGQTVNIFDAFFQVLPPWLVTGLTLCFVMMIVFSLMNKIHF